MQYGRKAGRMMDEMIFKKAAIDAAIEAADEWDGGCNPEREKAIRTAIMALPTVDATQVVRCKDCKFHSCEKGVPYCSNLDYGYGWEGEDFCSKGERRKKDGND